MNSAILCRCLFSGMLNHYHNFDGFSCLSHRINYGLYEYLFNVIVVLIIPAFLGFPYSCSMGSFNAPSGGAKKGGWVGGGNGFGEESVA